MPEKQSTQVVKHGDVTQRVGVQVIRARGVDVEKLIKMLIANAAAEFASRCIRTSMPPRLQFQLNVRTIHPDVVGAHPLRRRWAEHLAGADLEFGAMPGASDLVALELPL